MPIRVASYPRSGNTFLRIVLHRRYGIRTSTVYDVDGVAARLGSDAVGYADVSDFVKTHRPRDPADDDPAICLVRDGRDSVVSWARQLSEEPGRSYENELRRLLTDTTVGTSLWGDNVLSWLRPPAPQRALLRYEDLIRDPAGAVDTTLATLGLSLEPLPGSQIPTFDELHGTDPLFFRRGHTGTHHDELPPDLHDLFWSHPPNAEAMALLGLPRVAAR